MSRTGQEEQIIYALRQAEAGKKAGEICGEMGVTFAGVLQLSSGVTVKLDRIPVVENVVQ